MVQIQLCMDIHHYVSSTIINNMIDMQTVHSYMVLQPKCDKLTTQSPKIIWKPSF